MLNTILPVPSLWHARVVHNGFVLLDIRAYLDTVTAALVSALETAESYGVTRDDRMEVEVRPL